jgi:hypothetical protein
LVFIANAHDVFFEYFGFDSPYILGPVAGWVGVVLDFVEVQVQFGVQIVQVVYGDRFQCSGQLGAAEFVLTVVGNDNVLEGLFDILGEWFSGLVLEGFGLLFDPNRRLDDVSDKLTFIAILKIGFIDKFGGFTQVMYEHAGQDQIEAELGVTGDYQ